MEFAYNSQQRRGMKTAHQNLLRKAVATKQDARIVEFLLVDLLSQSPGQDTKTKVHIDPELLNIAIATGCADNVAVLLEHAGSYFRENHCRRAFMQAIKLGHVAVVSAMMEHAHRTATTNREAERDETHKMGFEDWPNFTVDRNHQKAPLHLAIKLGNVEIVKLLLENSANPTLATCCGETPLHAAATRNLHVCTRLLIQHGANPDSQQTPHGSTPLHIACLNGFLDTARELHGDPNALDFNHDTPLVDACRSGNVSVIAWLLQNGARPNSGKGDLCLASALDYRTMPKSLIELGLDPWQHSRNGDTIAHVVIVRHNDQMEEEGDDDDNDSQSDHGDFAFQFADELFGTDASLVNARNGQQMTPLHLSRVPAMIQLLVGKYGADLLATDANGRSSLFVAMTTDDTAKVESLLILMKERDVNIDTVDTQGWTALHWAIFCRKAEFVRLLLEFGADRHKRNAVGRTPLHLVGYAFSRTFPGRDTHSYGDHDISRVLNARNFPSSVAEKDPASLDDLNVLISRGADASMPDDEGNLPFFLAAATSRLSEIFLMMRAAATQGLFGKSSGLVTVSVKGSTATAGNNKRKPESDSTGAEKHPKLLIA